MVEMAEMVPFLPCLATVVMVALVALGPQEPLESLAVTDLRERAAPVEMVAKEETVANQGSFHFLEIAEMAEMAVKEEKAGREVKALRG